MPYHFKVRRYNPERDDGPWWGQYEVDIDPTDAVLTGLHHIKWHIDGTLALRRSCAHGICGSDGMVINGRNALACKVLVKDLAQPITVEPMRGYDVLKDLIVDLEPFFASYRSVMPYLVNDDPPPDKERYQSQADRARFDDTTKCILCACCTTACPPFWANKAFVGPASLVQAHRFIFDSRDQGADQRLEILKGRHGVFRCRTVFNCTDACPRGIKITRAIQEMKQELLVRSL